MDKNTLEWLAIKEKLAQRYDEAYKEGQERAIRAQKIEADGIQSWDDMIFYLETNKIALEATNQQAVRENNMLLYVETAAIKRFIENTLNLLRINETENTNDKEDENQGYQ